MIGMDLPRRQPQVRGSFSLLSVPDFPRHQLEQLQIFTAKELVSDRAQQAHSVVYSGVTTDQYARSQHAVLAYCSAFSELQAVG